MITIKQIYIYLLSILMTTLLLSCDGEILEKLPNDVPENDFCPISRLPNGLCPSAQNAQVASISSVEFVTANGNYGLSSTIDLSITFNEIVTVDSSLGIPQIELETGTIDQFAEYVSGSETSSLTFRYTVSSGDVSTDLDYKAITSLTLNGGTIVNSVSNNATLTLPTVGTLAAAYAIAIDTGIPTITSVMFTSIDGNYATASNIDLQIVFSEAVTVNSLGGTPQVQFETGTTDRFATYFSGSGTTSLTFRYSVSAGDTATDLDYKTTTSLALNGGTIKSSVSNDAILTLPIVGTLATAHAITINATTTHIWDFGTAGDYTYPSNYVEISAGVASLKTVDTTHSGTDFNSGSHVGTYVDGNNITLLDKPTAASTHVNTILPDKAANLVGYWRMDGDLQDSSSLGHDGLGTVGFVDSKVGTGAADCYDTTSLISINHYAEIEHSSMLSVSLWVNPTVGYGTGSNPGIISKKSSWGGIWVGGTGGLWGRVYQSNGVAINLPINSHLSAETWSHIVLIANSSTNRIYQYLNGKEVGVVAYDGTIRVSNDTLLISKQDSDSFFGKIDDVAVWNAALSTQEVHNLYESQNANYTELSSSWTPKWDSIVGYWKMDGNWQDSSGNGNDGTAEGGITFSNNTKIGSQASNFDGSDDCIRVTDGYSVLSGNNTHTISFWIYPDSSGSDIIFNAANLGGNDYFIQKFGSGGSGLHWSVGGSYRTYSSVNISTEKWSHVVLKKTGTDTGNLYVNGVEITSFTGSHSSTVTGTSDLLIGCYLSSGFEYSGQLDDFVIWNKDLSENDIFKIYNRQKQKYAGHYDSPVIDLGTSAPWENITPVTTLPFLKELPGTESESSSDYSDIFTGDTLNNGLVGYWPLNETIVDSAPGGTDFEDKSGNNNHGIENGGILLGENKYISYAAETFDNDVFIFSDIELNGASEFTFSLWYNFSECSIFGGGAANGWNAFNFHTWSDCKIYVGTDIGNRITPAMLADPLVPNEWIHQVFTYNLGVGSLYINGNLVATNSGMLPPTTWGGFRISNSSGVKVLFDEFALWSRSLDANEIIQLYRRGANRIKYQVKSCVDSSCNCKSFSTTPAGSINDCNGDGTPNATDLDDTHLSEWLGKDGATGETFSELQNCSALDVNGDCDGDVNATSPDFNFTDFPVAAQSSDNRYFQYRVIMEAEENTACSGAACMPELTSIEVGPTGRHYGGSPEIIPNSPVAYTEIEDISFTEGGSCTLTYQLSPDGTNYYYWNGTNWVGASGVAQSSSSSDVNSNISTFTTETSVGNLFWKAFMTSDTTQSCQVDDISVTVPD